MLRAHWPDAAIVFMCASHIKTFVARRRGVWTRANMEETRAHVCFFSRALGKGDGPGARGDLRVEAAASVPRIF